MARVTLLSTGLAAALCAAVNAEAAFISYNSAAAWAAAEGPATITEDFEGFAVDTSLQGGPVLANNMSLTASTGANGANGNLIDVPPVTFAGYSVNGSNQVNGDLRPGDVLRIDFIAPVLAWGATFNQISDDVGVRNTNIFVYDSSDMLLGTVLTASTANAFDIQFYGFGLTSGAASYIVFQNVVGSIDYWGMDDVVMTTGTQVPEPAGLALLGVGLLGTGLARRRRG